MTTKPHSPLAAHMLEIVARRQARYAGMRKTSENRREAQRTGAKTYAASVSCMRGHEPLRYTRNGVCVGCYDGLPQEKRDAYAAGLLTMKEARERGMRFFLPAPSENICKATHVCLARLNRWGSATCISCETIEKRRERKARQGAKPRAPRSFLD